MPAMPTVVFIMGLAHCGSTLLDMMLSRHPYMTGIGEAARTMRTGERGWERSQGFHCANGDAATENPLWSRIFATAEPSDDPVAAYGHILPILDEVLPTGGIIVDSGKYARYLEALAGRSDVSVKVIHLVRDVRSHTAAERRRATAEGRPFGGALKTYRKWARANRADADFLVSRELPTFRLGYEELCLNTHRALAAIANFLGIEDAPAMRIPSGEGSWALRGNRRAMSWLQETPEGANPVIYDSQWMTDDVWLLPEILLPPVRKLNRMWVYGNHFEAKRETIAK